MHVVRHASGRALLDHASAALERNEAENNLVLSVCARLGDGARIGDAVAYLATIDGDDGVIGAAICTPPHNVATTRLPEAALDLLVDDLRDAGVSFPGVTGPLETATSLAARLAAITGATTRVFMRQCLYRLLRVIPPPRVPGALRPATVDDERLLVEWSHAFVVDSRLPAHELPTVEASVRRSIRSGTLHVWDDGGQLASMAGSAGRSRHGVRISFVYTPPERRRRGYASACVAALSQLLLDQGAAHCCLYTDLSNPTSNGVYQRIGYEWVSESQMIDLD